MHCPRAMRLLSAILFLSLSGSVASADDVQPADSKHRVSLRIVKMLPETQQALLFDKDQGTHVVAESGLTIEGFLVDTVDEDSVTLIAEDGTEIVLTAPPRTRRTVAKASDQRVTTVAPANPYVDTAAPANPYAAPPAAAAPTAVVASPV
ncbi:MAG: hypothetical protein HOV81_07875, partial [Kofleriaceae bacterium]|nr:hypothetical protein [Kofleriaceae bacterium]